MQTITAAQRVSTLIDHYRKAQRLFVDTSPARARNTPTVHSPVGGPAWTVGQLRRPASNFTPSAVLTTGQFRTE